MWRGKSNETNKVMKTEKPPPPNKNHSHVPPQWTAFLWYLPIMLFFLWMWQEAFSNLSVRNIAYSEFKSYLRQGDVAECIVKADTIEGKIQPRAPSCRASKRTRTRQRPRQPRRPTQPA